MLVDKHSHHRERTSCNCIHSSSNRDRAVGGIWRHSSIRFWGKRL